MVPARPETLRSQLLGALQCRAGRKTGKHQSEEQPRQIRRLVVEDRPRVPTTAAAFARNSAIARLVGPRALSQAWKPLDCAQD